jgi:hypothetical protein
MRRRAGVKPLSTVEEGARAILNLATSPAVEGQTGLYFNGLREAKASMLARGRDTYLRYPDTARAWLAPYGGRSGRSGIAERRAARLEVGEPRMDTLLLVLDLIGTFVFALSGATAGVKSRLDLVQRG